MNNNKLKNRIHIAISLLIGILISLSIIFLWHPYMVSGVSMEPTFFHGNILICKKADNLSAGDVVIAKNDGATVVKRIVAIEGDVVEIRDGILYVNQKVSFWQFEKIQSEGILDKQITLNENEFFLMGDNRNDSHDSRAYGPVHREDIRYIVSRKIL